MSFFDLTKNTTANITMIMMTRAAAAMAIRMISWRLRGGRLAVEGKRGRGREEREIKREGGREREGEGKGGEGGRKRERERGGGEGEEERKVSWPSFKYHQNYNSLAYNVPVPTHAII